MTEITDHGRAVRPVAPRAVGGVKAYCCPVPDTWETTTDTVYCRTCGYIWEYSPTDDTDHGGRRT